MILHTPSSLIFARILCSGYYYSHLTDKDDEAGTEKSLFQYHMLSKWQGLDLYSSLPDFNTESLFN